MADPAVQQPCDPIWTAIRAEAWSEDERDPILRKFLKETILKSRRLEDALSLHLASKLGTEYVYPMILRALIDQAFEGRGLASRLAAAALVVRNRGDTRPELLEFGCELAIRLAERDDVATAEDLLQSLPGDARELWPAWLLVGDRYHARGATFSRHHVADNGHDHRQRKSAKCPAQGASHQ